MCVLLLKHDCYTVSEQLNFTINVLSTLNVKVSSFLDITSFIILDCDRQKIIDAIATSLLQERGSIHLLLYY